MAAGFAHRRRLEGSRRGPGADSRSAAAGAGQFHGRGEVDFPNDDGIFLHDLPEKELFAKDQRDLSNGCIRLQDAQRLGRWLMGSNPTAASSQPEQRVLLPKPVPVFVTYLTAHADSGQLTLVDDIYGRNSLRGGAVIASLHWTRLTGSLCRRKKCWRKKSRRRRHDSDADGIRDRRRD